MFFKIILVICVLIANSHQDRISEERFIVVSTTPNPSENKNTNKICDYLKEEYIEKSKEKFEQIQKKIENIEIKLEQKENQTLQVMKGAINEFVILTQSTENPIKMESQKRLETLELQINELQAKLQEKDGEINQLTTNLDQVKNFAPSAKNSQITEILKRIETVENGDVEKQLESQDRLEKLEVQINELQEKLEEKDGEINQLTKRLDQVKNFAPSAENSQMTEILKRIETVEKRDVEKQQQISNLLEIVKKRDVERVQQQNVIVTTPTNFLPKNCKQVLERGNTKSGIYQIKPKNTVYNVECDLESTGGGWTVLQKRFDGSQEFNLNWQDYKNGFGNLSGEFWLGLEPLHELTGSGDINNELLVLMVDGAQKESNTYYRTFGVGNDNEKYMLKGVGGYSGTIPALRGDFLAPLSNHPFATKDREIPRRNCVHQFGGGWWTMLPGCWWCNLNGEYSSTGRSARPYRGLYWRGLSANPRASFVKTKMLVRPG